MKSFWVYACSFVKSFFEYYRNVRHCRKIDYFHYKELVSVDFDPVKSFKSVLSYGNYRAISNIKGHRFNFLRDYLEHGLHFGETIDSVLGMGYINRPFIRNVYTFSAVRKKTIEHACQELGIKNRKVYAVGPYIKAVNNFYSIDQLSRIKNKYGRILLVYPVHSTRDNAKDYDIVEFIEKINEIKSHFQSVFVCMYWQDIYSYPQYIDAYLKQGFIIVSNGHSSDPMFLSRQKDLIMLSDMMMTNSVGTHIGYSICLDRPVYMVGSPFDKNGKPLFVDGFVEESQMFFDVFKDFDFEIKDKQIQLIEKYWGRWKENQIIKCGTE